MCQARVHELSRCRCRCRCCHITLATEYHLSQAVLALSLQVSVGHSVHAALQGVDVRGAHLQLSAVSCDLTQAPVTRRWQAVCTKTRGCSRCCAVGSVRRHLSTLLGRR